MKEISCGGVVEADGKILLLRKFSGDWVLPKGHIEMGETMEEAAIREVREETGIHGEILKYIGYIRYSYTIRNRKNITKTVHFYAMRALNNELQPQREEGFAQAALVELDVAMRLIRFDAEKKMILKAREIQRKSE